MAYYSTFIVLRESDPDGSILALSLRTIEPTIGVQHNPGTREYRLKKNTEWSSAEIAAAQSILESSPEIDSAVMEMDRQDLKALALGLWEAISNPLLTRPQLRARCIAIRRTLP